MSKSNFKVKKGITSESIFVPVNQDAPIPNEIDIERLILGMVLIDGNCIDVISKDFTEQLFFYQQNQLIARSIIELYRQSAPINLMSVKNELTKSGDISTIGGIGYIMELTNITSSSTKIEFFIKILQQYSLRRTMIEVCGSAQNKAYREGEDVFDVYAELQNNLENSLKELMTYEIASAGTINDELIKESLETLRTGVTGGVPSCFQMLDNHTGGWQKSGLIIFAARTSMGKTIFGVNVAANAAIEKGIATAIFTLEMSKEEVIGRVQSMLSGVPLDNIARRNLTRAQIELISEKCKVLEKAPMYVDDTPNISLIELKSKARKLVKDHNVKLIVVDYLQLMRSGQNIPSREQEVSEISRGLKALAKELAIPVIALAQLNREAEKRPDKKPQLSDLRESGSIEQDSDAVFFCYRPEYYGITEYELEGRNFDTFGLFVLIVAKNRNGRLGELYLRLRHNTTKLENYEPSSSQTYAGIKNETIVNARNTYDDFDFKPSTDEEVPF